MIIKKIKFATFVLSGLLLTNVLYGAAESSTYQSGTYTGLLFGYSGMNSTVKEGNYIPGNTNGSGKSTKLDSGIVGEALLGYRHFFEGQTLLGFELGFSLDNNEVTQITNINSNGYTSSTKYKAPFKFTPAFVFGKQLTHDFLGFIKLGMSISQFKGTHFLKRNGNTSDLENFKTTRNGFMCAVGGEYALNERFSTLGILSYESFAKIHNTYEDPSGGAVIGSNNIAALKPEYITAKVGVVYRF
ncbi:MAG: hypothetical protein JSS34_06745 [Proteobacteria bacterium]|nr:hypothetical protein [Pseudomonadota bacterium]